MLKRNIGDPQRLAKGRVAQNVSGYDGGILLSYYYYCIISSPTLLINSNHLEVQAKLCAAYPYLGIAAMVFGVARPSVQSELFHMSLFPVANG